MKVKTHETLWKKIQQFELDDAEARVKFSGKLASENNWPADYTSHAINEYKKFIFLCCISPTGASPSPPVDKVWHLHLTYTQNYWKAFCQQTLGKEIHHHPSKGGDSERERHREWYQNTLELYRDVFEESPPSDIWPPQQQSKVQYPPDELPPLNYFAAYRKHLYILLTPFLLPLFFTKLHPFHLTGPQFIWFYGSLLIATVVFLLKVRQEKKQMLEQLLDETPIQTSNWYAIARFVYGKHRAIQAAIVDLVAKGVLVAEGNDRFSFYPGKLDYETRSTNPLASNLHHHHSPDQFLRMNDVPDFYDEDLTYDAGLAALYYRTNRKDVAAFAIIILVILLGFLRMKQGDVNGYSTTYLSYMVIIGAFFLIIFAASVSTSGLFHDAFAQRYQPKYVSGTGPDSLVPKFVLLGLTALTGTYAFASLENMFRNHRPDDGGGSISSGCGSSGCGSSCGGGCGGCGGGD